MVHHQGKGSVGQWLMEKCQEERMSLRRASQKIGISHTTIADLIKGHQPSPSTIKKLAAAFSGDGDRQRLALEDKLLVFASYRTERPEGEDLGELMARVMDKLSQFSEPQLKLIQQFAEFISKMGDK